MDDKHQQAWSTIAIYIGRARWQALGCASQPRPKPGLTCVFMERTTRFELATLNLGKVVLYQLSHVRSVAPDSIAPASHLLLAPSVATRRRGGPFSNQKGPRNG